jgi:DNA-binding response OmpR family regulator
MGGTSDVGPWQRLSRYMDRTIDVLILRLRRKIEAVPSKPVHLQTLRGQGYWLPICPV